MGIGRKFCLFCFQRGEGGREREKEGRKEGRGGEEKRRERRKRQEEREIEGGREITGFWGKLRVFLNDRMAGPEGSMEKVMDGQRCWAVMWPLLLRPV